MIASDLDRRRFLKLAGISAAALTGVGAMAACGTEEKKEGATGTRTLTWMSPFGLDLSYVPVLTAVSGGFFEDRNIDVEAIGGKGSSQAVQQVLAGNVQIAQVGALDLIRARVLNDAPVTAIATIAQEPVFNWVSSADAPLKTAEDFVGKTIGIASVGGTTDAFLDIMLKAAGIDTKSVKRVVTGASVSNLELLRRGRVDAFVASADTVGFFESTKAPVYVLPVAKVVRMPGQTYFVSDRYLAENKSLLSDWLAAVDESLRHVLKQMKDGTTASLLDPLRRDFANDLPALEDTDAAVLAIESRSRVWTAAGEENILRNVEDQWNAAAEVLAAAGMIPASSDLSEVYTNDLLG